MSDTDKWLALRAPFPASSVSQLPKGGAKLDYVGHAEVTDRMLSVDPEWNWEPMALDERGLPLFHVSGNNGAPIGFWIRLTICGVTRLGYGSVAANVFDPEKQLIGDAIRNAAMRFGIALDMWSKSDRAQAAVHDGEPAPAPARRPAPVQAPPAQHGPAVTTFDPDTGEIADEIADDIADDLPFADGEPTPLPPAQEADHKAEWLTLLSMMVKSQPQITRADIVPIIGGFTQQAFGRWLDGHAGRSASVCMDTASAARGQGVRS